MAQNPLLSQLTSYSLFYRAFDDDSKDDCSSNGKSAQELGVTLKSKLGQYSREPNETKKIMNAYCTACERKRLGSWGDAPCYLFYYWLGHNYWNPGNREKLSDLMNKIYNALGAHFKGKKCEVKYEEVDRKLLNNRKTIFEYYNDYNKIEGDLLNSNPDCSNDQWSGYREDVIEACKDVQNDCKVRNKKSDDQYCNDFKDKYDAYCDIANLLQWTCTKISTLEKGTIKEKDTEIDRLREQLQGQRERVSKLEQEAAAAQTAASLAKDEAVRSATTTSSISSIIGTLATIGAPFLLYKYKPWSSWFSKHTSGNGARSNRRRRRSATGNIDAFTESTSTYDSTDTSTIDGTYFASFGKRRKRYRRAYQVRGPPALEEQLLDPVDDQDDAAHAYTLVKQRKPRSTPKRRMKKRVPGRRGGVCRRMIIDIHLDVLKECQKGDLHSTKEDFFEILVQEFMGSEFMNEENVPMEEVPEKQVPSSDFGFREEDFVLKEKCS
ncbi:KIR protein [Plasmodium coatneyi]|uniref:KIR protein n=1 Tax=Plasmodium coatneyi TaxID=208452 RepID=A0A1B1E6S4_9APIC|nr:KIR protein [Plasmodium coatneyi]ANQ10732.1 KIR protein [Plasmodium coatneyi]